MSRKAVFRGNPVEVVQARVRNRKEGHFYYEVRLADEAWSTPATLEEKVQVNFWGTVVTSEKLEFGEDDYLELTDAEAKSILVDQEEPEEAGSSAP